MIVNMPLCYHLARRRCGFGADADDMAQAGAVAMLEGRNPAWGIDDWLRSWLGQRWKTARSVGGQQQTEIASTSAQSPLDRAEASDFIEWACAQTTDSRARLIRALYGGEGCRTQREVAAEMGVTESAVAHLHKKAIDDIREALT